MILNAILNKLQQRHVALLVFTCSMTLCTPAYPHDEPQGPEHARHPIAYPVYPKINYGTGERAKRLKKGEYLVKAADCLACHTDYKKGAKPFSGGEPIKTPFGTVTPPNITPDKTTGIGHWTPKQFVRALRKGVAPDHSFYYPVFPYPYFNRLSDKDALLIKEYMDAVPPVMEKNKPAHMMFPFNWRFLQLGWRILFFYPNDHSYRYNPKQSKAWNRGAYLVESLTHCGMCHTPINLLGAPKKKYYLAGSSVTGMYAPDITSRGLKPYTDAQIMRVFTEGKTLNGKGELMGPMKEAEEDSFKYLTRDDIQAIITYLRTVKSESPPKASGSNKGQGIYQQYCTGCHTTGAGGAPKYGDATAWAPLVKQGKAKLYHNAIMGIGGMPAKGNCATCSDEDIHAAVDYILLSIGSSSGKPSRPKGPKPKRLTRQDGARIYHNTTCATCHATGRFGAPKMGDTHAWQVRVQQGMDVLFRRTIQGYGHMPPRGGCAKCTDAELIAATKYMVQSNVKGGNYDLW